MIKAISIVIIGALFGSAITFLIMILKQKKIDKLNTKLAEAMKEATNMIAENLTNNNEWFAEKQKERDKKYMEEQLKIKLEQEEEEKKIDEEILRKIKEIT